MDGARIQQVAAERAQELPGAEMGHPFGPDWDVYKVRGKVFMLQTEITGPPMVTVKATPADSAVLQQAHPEVVPGYHMNKRHWITLMSASEGTASTLDAQIVTDLVTESYLLVIERNLPRAEWPVDPESFGQR